MTPITESHDYVSDQIEKHELLEMRRVAAYIYKKAGRWKQSIALSKKDNLYKDAMETASQSGDRELAEELLVYFIDQVRTQAQLYMVVFPYLEVYSYVNHVQILLEMAARVNLH